MLLIMYGTTLPVLIGVEKYADGKVFTAETRREVSSPLAHEAKHYLHGAVGTWIAGVYLGMWSFVFTYFPELENWDLWTFRISIGLLVVTPVVLARGLYLARLVWK